jgi:hypothetical protein
MKILNLILNRFLNSNKKKNIKKHIFIFNTGRCCSGAIAHLLNQSKKISSYHCPDPELIKEKFFIQQNKLSAKKVAKRKIRHIHKILKYTNIYSEANPNLYCIADDLIKNLNPEIIWSIRHPYEYVNSGINRKWYNLSDNIWDQYRERPINGWDKNWSQQMKIAWLWCYINSKIEKSTYKKKNFKITVSKDKSLENELIEAIKYLNINDIDMHKIKKILNLNINVGKYSAKRNKKNNDHIFGEQNNMKTNINIINKLEVNKIIENYWLSENSKNFIEYENIYKKDKINYQDLLEFFINSGFRFEKYSDLKSHKKHKTIFLRHDVDLYDSNKLYYCLNLEEQFNLKSTWFFLPPKDYRYIGNLHKIESFIKILKKKGHYVGLHINGWEKNQSLEFNPDPKERIDDHINWMKTLIGDENFCATAHGITRHRHVSNFSFYDYLLTKNIELLDPFIINSSNVEDQHPHFFNRVRNPLFDENLLIKYLSDTGKKWNLRCNKIDDLKNENLIVLNTHAGNYDLREKF